MPRPVLITGATGKQGGAVIRALLASPRRNEFTIYALTRSTTSPPAKRLTEAGGENVKLIQGDLNNVDAIFKSLPERLWGVFSVQTAMGKGGATTEESQGKALVDAALSYGTSHFVYTSVDRGGSKSLTNPTDVPHFISKHRVEQHLISQTANNPDMNMGWTILRPTAFMDNFTDDFMGRVLPTAWRDVLGEKPLQLISAKDIGKFGAKAFLNPEGYNHKEIALAGDELSFSQLNGIFKERTGKDVPTTYGLVVKFISWVSTEFGNMMRWFKTDGYRANVQECRREVPELMDFKTWLERESAWKKA